MKPRLPLAAAILLLAACDPIQGTGPGTPPDPARYLRADPATHSAVLTLVGGYPAGDYAFNYDGYAYGTLRVTLPEGWTLTVQCENRATVPTSCAVVRSAADRAPADPAWSTPDPLAGLAPQSSAGFSCSPPAGTYRIASLVGGDEASGMFAILVVAPGASRAAITAPPR